MIRTEEDWIRQYRLKEAFWIHDGNPKRPHTLLTSGRHSDGFFNSRLIISDESLLSEGVLDLLELLSKKGGNISKVQGVVGPQTGATKLAELVSMQIMTINKDCCFYASPAKNESDGKKSMVFTEKDLDLLPGQSILLCEDVLTTGGSIDLTTIAVTKAGGILLPFVLTLVNRSGLNEINGKKIIALINHSMTLWTSEKCPLCNVGSVALRPKDNWTRLNNVFSQKL